MILSPDDIIGSRQWSPDLAREAWDLTRHVWQTDTNNGRFDRAIIMCGLPGSGKSTLARKLDDDRTIILDSTMTVEERRAEYERLAGIPVMFVVAVCNPATAIERQDGRAFPVPAEVVTRMARQWTDPTIKQGRLVRFVEV